MKYSVIKVINGNYLINSEHDNLQSAIINYHNLCSSLWNAADVYDATVAIFDENLYVATQGVEYKEHIHHDEPAPEPEENGESE